MQIKKEYLYLGAAALFAYYWLFIRNKGRTEQNITDSRATQLAGGDQPTITEVEARNLCRKIQESLSYYNLMWGVLGGSELWAPLSAMWAVIENNRANTILVIQAWKYLYSGTDYPNLSAALASEYLLWGSSTSALRDKVVARLNQFPV